MKTISLWQPWATLMASGAKRIETRSWTPRGLRPGQLVAIHAAKCWTVDERDACQDNPFIERALSLAERRGLWSFEQPPLGCVVAIARFERTEATETLRSQLTQAEQAFGNYTRGRYGWVFSEVRPLVPILARGAQGLFDWTPPPVDELVYLEACNAMTRTAAPADTASAPSGAMPTPPPTRVVHCHKEAFDVYIGRKMPRYPELRATGWGNPYTAKNLPPGCANAVEAYRAWIATQPRLLARLPELRGKTLGCWCAPVGGLPGNLDGHICHGEVLAALADGATTGADVGAAMRAEARR